MGRSTNQFRRSRWDDTVEYGELVLAAWLSRHGRMRNTYVRLHEVRIRKHLGRRASGSYAAILKYIGPLSEAECGARVLLHYQHCQPGVMKM